MTKHALNIFQNGLASNGFSIIVGRIVFKRTCNVWNVVSWFCRQYQSKLWSRVHYNRWLIETMSWHCKWCTSSVDCDPLTSLSWGKGLHFVISINKWPLKYYYEDGKPTHELSIENDDILSVSDVACCLLFHIYTSVTTRMMVWATTCLVYKIVNVLPATPIAQ